MPSNNRSLFCPWRWPRPCQQTAATISHCYNETKESGTSTVWHKRNIKSRFLGETTTFWDTGCAFAKSYELQETSPWLTNVENKVTEKVTARIGAEIIVWPTCCLSSNLSNRSEMFPSPLWAAGVTTPSCLLMKPFWMFLLPFTKRLYVLFM